MKNRNLFVAAVIVLSFVLSAAHSSGAVKSEEPKQPSTQKISTAKAVAPKAAAAKAVAPKAAVAKAVAPKVAAAKAAMTKAVAPKAQTKGMGVTKEGMIAELKEGLADTKDVLGMIPELKTAIDRDGKVVYIYGGAALEDLSREDMVKLLSRVRQALVKIRTDRIQRQLETTRRVERLQSATDVQQPPRVPRAAPSVPKSPPSLPSAPPRR